ncbi:8962_t:CDS:1, partial [Acaulospora morrowiae]
PSSKLFCTSFACFHAETAIDKKVFPFALKTRANSYTPFSRANTVRFFNNKPYTPLTSNDGLKKVIALGGAVYSFWHLESNVVVNGIIAFAAYKLIKSTLDFLWPPRNVDAAAKYDPIFPVSKYWPLTLPFTQNAVSRLHASSVKQIQMAYESNYDDLRNHYGGSSSSSIMFSPPHLVSSQTLGFGTIGSFKKQDSVKIEYWTTGRNGKRALVRVKGSLGRGDIDEISIYWSDTRRWLDIPLGGFEDSRQYETSRPPDIIEAEYRDIKKKK